MNWLDDCRPDPGRCVLVAVMGAVTLAAGCTRYVYEIDLTPRGESIERTISASKSVPGTNGGSSAPLPDEEQLRLEEVYGQLAERVGSESRLTRTFTGAMPQDVGGAGTYTHWDTSLGSVSFYLERFRGETDFLRHVEDRLRAADLAIDLLKVFVDAEAANSPAGRRLRGFVDGDLRRDAQDLTLLVWALQVAHPGCLETGENDAATVHLVQFLLEREYLELNDLPGVMIAASAEQSDRQFRRIFARKLGLTESELTAALPPLSSPEQFEQAFSAALIDSNEYRRCLTFLPESDRVDTADPTGPGQVYFDLLLVAIGSPLSEHDSLTVRLHPPQAPFSTNGTVSEEGALTWSTQLAVPGNPSLHALPMLCFAAWSGPNDEFQTARFGKVLLDGRALGEYVLWRRGLNGEEGRTWDAFVAALTPEDPLSEAKLNEFRFQTTPADADVDGRVEIVKRILLDPVN